MRTRPVPAGEHALQRTGGDVLDMPADPPRSATSRAARLARTRRSARTCQRCPLWAHATQTVFGEGLVDARIMLIGEQPGDREDLAGHPFVGPAGRVLHEALTRAGLADEDVYITNAVKHFKWEPRGKRRIHKRPNQQEAAACRLWLDQEIALVRPRAIIALGATAASMVVAPSVRVTRDRGRPLESPLAPLVTVTVHPSAILRVPERAARHAALAELVRDLRFVADAVRGRRTAVR
jgi:DNA polymerase